MLTRPDILYAVSVMSRYIQNLKMPNLEVVLRILKYVKSQLTQSIVQEM